MTPEQALEILDHVASKSKMSREDHVQIQTATEILSKVLKEIKKIEGDIDERVKK